MTELQSFAFIYLPIGIVIFGFLLAGVGVTLISRAGHARPVKQAEPNTAGATILPTG